MNEKMKILKMVEEGIVTSEEALKLMEAIEIDTVYKTDVEKPKMRGKKLKVLVIDPDGKKNVDIKIPLSLVNLGFRIGGKFSPELKNKVGDTDIEALIQEALEEFNETGTQTIVDVHEENGTVVKVTVE